MPHLYHMPASGNCYKIRLLCAQLDIPLTETVVDLTRGETRTAEFLARNPNGKVPTLVLDDGEVLAESDAILCYLADGTPLWPAERLPRARTLQWLFFEQYSHEPYIATNRAWLTLFGRGEEMAERIAANMEPGYAALRVMEGELSRRDFLVEDYSIADIALFAYTHVADEGGYDLDRFPAIRAWLDRVRAQPRFIPMQAD